MYIIDWYNKVYGKHYTYFVYNRCMYDESKTRRIIYDILYSKIPYIIVICDYYFYISHILICGSSLEIIFNNSEFQICTQEIYAQQIMIFCS